MALYSGDAHTLWLNSAALAELGVTRDSVPPAGGTYDRDEAGELTGIVREAAAMELMPRIVSIVYRRGGGERLPRVLRDGSARSA